MTELRVLTVCTMNICRSPAMEVKFSELAAAAGIDAEVASGGVHAIAGTPRCEISLAHAGRIESIGYAHPVWELDPDGFDLILTAQQSHLNALLEAAPQLWDRAFTLVRAGSLATQLGGLSANRADPAGFVAQLAALDVATERPVRGRWAPHDPVDIPDPHVLGTNLHEMTAQLIHTSVTTLIHG